MKKDKKKIARVIATWVVTGVMLSIFILDTVVLALDNKYTSAITITHEDFSDKYGDDKIHFLNTANSDCILLESNGKFALVDSGEGNENPRKDPGYKGYRDEVLSYIKKVAVNEKGSVELEFILATHMHYDHAGNFTSIINDKDITINKAFIKEYDTSSVSAMDKKNWGNGEMYESIISSLKGKNIPLFKIYPSRSFFSVIFRFSFLTVKHPRKLL